MPPSTRSTGTCTCTCTGNSLLRLYRALSSIVVVVFGLGDLLDSTHSTLLTLMLRLLDACGVDCDHHQHRKQRSRMRRSKIALQSGRTRYSYSSLDTRIRTTVTPALPLTKKGAPAITHKQHQHRQAYYLPPPLLLISATHSRRKGRAGRFHISSLTQTDQNPKGPEHFYPAKQSIH